MHISRRTVIITAMLIFMMAGLYMNSIIDTGMIAQERQAMDDSKLCVVWTSGDKEVAIKMVYMYTLNAKKQGWFGTVRFVIWGPSSKLLSEDADLQDYLKKMKEAGVEIQACKACTDMYSISGKLEQMGVDVKYMGKPLSDMLKSDWKVMTF